MKLIAKTLLFILLSIPSLVFAEVIFVNHAATGLNNGTSWQDAFTDLQDALNSFPTPDTIWVAKGTYYPTSGTDRYISYHLPNGVALYGGFEGGETELSQRDWESNETILSGDIGVQGDHSDNSFTVLYATQTDTTTLIDGLIIQFGNSNSSIPIESPYGPTKCGGALFLDAQDSGNETSIKIRNCHFKVNYASGQGGAIFFAGQNSATNYFISNSQFENNYAENSGGAIGKIGGCTNFQNILSSVFINNHSQNFGGAIWSNDPNIAIDLNISNCNFNNNSAALGGAISKTNFFGTNNHDLHISDCFFENNSASTFGNALYDGAAASGDIYIIRSSFKGNATNPTSSTIFCEGAVMRDLIISHCNFIENVNFRIIDTDFNLYLLNNLFYKNSYINPSYESSCIHSHYTGNKIEIVNNIFFKNDRVFYGSGELKVANSIFWDNPTFFNRKNFYLRPNSTLEIESSIFDVVSCDSITEFSPLSNNINLFCHPDVLFNVDPLFRDTANLDFSLLSCSPAINAGNNAIIDSLGILEDLAGNNRVLEGTVDIGAYEQAYLVSLDSVQHESCFGNSNGAVLL